MAAEYAPPKIFTMEAKQDITENPVKTESLGDTTREKPDVVLVCQHDGDAKAFLERYPQLLKAYADEPETLHQFLELERDIGSGLLAEETAKALLEISEGAIRIDLVKVEVPRGVIDSNRLPEDMCDPGDNPSGVHMGPIRNIFDHSEHTDLIREFTEIHRKIVNKIRTAIQNLSDDGLFLDIHAMWDNDVVKKEGETIQESPGLEGLREYIEKIMKPGGRERALNILTRFEGQPHIAHMGLVKELERLFEELEKEGIKVDRNIPYSYLGFSTCSQIALDRPKQGASIDVPTKYLAKDGQSDYIRPELDLEKIKKLAYINAQALWNNLQENSLGQGNVEPPSSGKIVQAPANSSNNAS